MLGLISFLLASFGVQSSIAFIVAAPTKKRGGGRARVPPAELVEKNEVASAESAERDDWEGGAGSVAGKKKKPRAGRRRKSTEPLHWRDENDAFVIIAADDSLASFPHANEEDGATSGGGAAATRARDVNSHHIRKSINFTVRGNPRSLIRHRTARGFVYNPSRAAQDSFRDCLLGILPPECRPAILDDGDDSEEDGGVVPEPSVLFPREECLRMSLTFRMKRPKSHFVGGKPGPGRMRPTAPGKLYGLIRSDVDNLVKFVMDSLIGVLYEDDRQVVSLSAAKVLDTDGLCRGATEVEISVLREEDL